MKARPFTIEQLQKTACASLNPHLFEQETKGRKKSKYGNTKVEFDGHVFDSKKEMRRYVELRMLAVLGEIEDLKLQVPFELNEGGTHSLKYVADFTYTVANTGEKVVEDAKGYRTQAYKKKRRLMQEVHGIRIKEI